MKYLQQTRAMNGPNDTAKVDTTIVPSAINRKGLKLLHCREPSKKINTKKSVFFHYIVFQAC